MITTNLEKKECRQLAAWLTSSTPFQVNIGLGKNFRTLHFSLESGCACSMLAESADWNAKIWTFREEVLPQLTDGVSSFANKYESGFIFEAMWVGDKSEGEQTVTVEELLKLIKTNQVHNKLTYKVIHEANNS